MEAQIHYHKGLFFITYLLINSDREISDDELVYLHKMRIEEGIDDYSFSEYFKVVLETSEKELYQTGIESLNRCPDEYKIRAFERLFQLAYADKVLKPREVRFILYAIKLTHTNFNKVLRLTEMQSIQA
jgi:hypothetical protein